MVVQIGIGKYQRFAEYDENETFAAFRTPHFSIIQNTNVLIDRNIETKNENNTYRRHDPA
jgi:hypothetical protein